jgi:hypothetical protein
MLNFLGVTYLKLYTFLLYTTIFNTWFIMFLIGVVTGNKVNSIKIKDVDSKYSPELNLC